MNTPLEPLLQILDFRLSMISSSVVRPSLTLRLLGNMLIDDGEFLLRLDKGILTFVDIFLCTHLLLLYFGGFTIEQKLSILQNNSFFFIL